MNCPECDSIMILKNSKYGKFYGCSKYPLCKGTHGAHPDGRPLGIPANKETKLLRTEAHKLLGEMFGDWNTITKKQKAKMYDWLKENTSMGHISMLMKDELVELIEELKLGNNAEPIKEYPDYEPDR